jgi:hypothetical protein
MCVDSLKINDDQTDDKRAQDSDRTGCGKTHTEKGVYDDYVLVEHTKSHKSNCTRSINSKTKPSLKSTSNREHYNGTRHKNKPMLVHTIDYDDYNPKHDIASHAFNFPKKLDKSNMNQQKIQNHSNNGTHKKDKLLKSQVDGTSSSSQDINPKAQQATTQPQDMPKRYSSMRSQRPNQNHNEKQQFAEEEQKNMYPKQQHMQSSPQQFINHNAQQFYDPTQISQQWHMSQTAANHSQPIVGATQIQLNHPTQLPYNSQLAHHLISTNTQPSPLPQTGISVAPQSPQLIQTQYYGFNYHIPTDYATHYVATQSPTILPTTPIYFTNTAQQQQPINIQPLHRQSKAIPIVNPEVRTKLPLCRRSWPGLNLFFILNRRSS